MVERWIVAPKVVGSRPSSYPMIYYNFLNKYNIFFYKTSLTSRFLFDNFFYNFFFINKYFFLNEIIWQEGLLIDFLQKKITDNWIKKFIIFSANLFNERLLFEKVIKIYLNYLIWPLHEIFIFEFNNISNLFFIVILLFLIIFFLFFLFFLFLF